VSRVRQSNRHWTVIFLFLIVFGLLTTYDSRLTPAAAESSANGAPIDTEVIVRVVGHGSMVLGDDVGGARVTITDVATGRLLAAGLQRGESGDQNQIMKTPRIMEEPRYSTKPSGSFHATLALEKPTVVEIAAQGPVAYPEAMKKVTTTVLLIPGQDITSDGIVLPLYGFIVQIEQPKVGDPQMAKQDTTLQASIRTMSGSPLRPHGDWDSRKIEIYGEVVVGDRVLERLQLFYSGSKALFEAPFTIPAIHDAPNGMTLRVVAADRANGHFGVGKADYPVVPEQFKPAKR
jgi:hypothetical protein